MSFWDLLKFGNKEKTIETPRIIEETEEIGNPKYTNKKCASCGGGKCTTKFHGLYWHKKCKRRVKKIGQKIV